MFDILSSGLKSNFIDSAKFRMLFRKKISFTILLSLTMKIAREELMEKFKHEKMESLGFIYIRVKHNQIFLLFVVM